MFGDTKKMGASLLANYRYYPDVDIDPVKLYVSGGLGGHLAITFGKKNSTTAQGPLLQQAEEVTGENQKEVKKEVKEEVKKEVKTLDKILDAISYKLKVGVDYEIAPQVVGTAALTVGGQLSGLKAKQMPDAMLEVGVRYNF